MATRTIIGIDTHISTCNYVAMEEKTDVILGADYFSTNTTNFIKSVSKFPKPRIVIIEQGPLANWIERTLENHVQKVVVADTKQNSWISRDPNKNDEVDAEKLARLYKGNFIKEIKSRSKNKAELISLVIHYHGLVKQQTRIKLQIGAKFRQGGKRKKGESGYKDENISLDLIYLSHNKAMQKAVLQYKDQLRLIEKQIKKTKIEMQKFSEKFPEIEFLRKFSGIGFVGSFTLSALIDIPERFSTVKKIWIYCGYGLDRQSSGSKFGRPMITKRSNRMLKDVIMTAVHNIIKLSKDNKYKTWFLDEIDNGKNPKKVKARLARKLIKDIWLEWRNFNDLNNKQH
jgi:transposase